MAQKLRRLFMIIIISAATFALLMTGTLAYNRLALTKPLEDKVTKISSIGSFSYQKLNTDEKIRVKFTEPTKLRSSFYQLLAQIEKKATAQGNMTIEVNNDVNEQLEQFFKDARLPIHEAISTGEYTALPDQLDSLVVGSQVEYFLEADGDFIFLSAICDTNTAYLVIKCSDTPLTVITTMGGEYL